MLLLKGLLCMLAQDCGTATAYASRHTLPSKNTNTTAFCCLFNVGTQNALLYYNVEYYE
jgi:hypothetical protein